MSRFKFTISTFFVITLILVTMSMTATASIEDFTTWTQVQDPAHSGMSGSIDNPNQVTLTATDDIPAATDIGYQSINGNTAAGSTAGHYFDSNQDFHIAVDFDVSTIGSVGLAGIGFGVGEDGNGENSAGVGLGVFNGSAQTFSGAARTDDNDAGAILFGPAATLSGRFFVRYDSIAGDIIVGVNTTPGSAAPSHTDVFSSIQNDWNGTDLIASFFLRSDSLFIFQPLSAGTVEAVFSNFEVLQGSAIAAVPVPGVVYLFALGCSFLINSRRRT